MDSQEIVAQIKSVLPKYTNAFTNNLSIASLERVGNIVTATTTLEHGLEVGNLALINGAKTAIEIESLTRFDTYAVAITTFAKFYEKFPISSLRIFLIEVVVQSC